MQHWRETHVPFVFHLWTIDAVDLLIKSRYEVYVRTVVCLTLKKARYAGKSIEGGTQVLFWFDNVFAFKFSSFIEPAIVALPLTTNHKHIRDYFQS